MSIKKQKDMKKSITASVLRADTAAYSVGFWKVPTIVHDKKVQLLIVRQNTEYLVAVASPVKIIKTCPTLESAVATIQNFERQANLHDITVLA